MARSTPPIRRKDSFGLEFQAYPDMESISKVLFDEMKIAVDGITGIQTLNKNRVVVKIRFTPEFNELMKKYEDKIVIAGSVRVKVVNLSQSYTFVSVRNAPFELEYDVILSILSR